MRLLMERVITVAKRVLGTSAVDVENVGATTEVQLRGILGDAVKYTSSKMTGNGASAC